MNYLKNYNLSDEQIQNIENAIKEHNVNKDIFEYDSEKITDILNLFLSIGVTNLYNIIITNPSMFCDTVSSIKNRINKYENKYELARLLNDDALNLNLIGLL